MFSACVVSDAACAAVNFLPVCTLTSWMNAASSAHALALSFASADAWISLALLARLFPGPTPGRRRDQVLVLLAQGRVGDDDLRRIGRVRQPDECPAREEVRAATTATATTTGRAERAPAAAPEAAPTTSAGAPATPPAEAGLAVVAERTAAGSAHRARAGFTAESAVAAILAGRLRHRRLQRRSYSPARRRLHLRPLRAGACRVFPNRCEDSFGRRRHHRRPRRGRRGR